MDGGTRRLRFKDRVRNHVELYALCTTGSVARLFQRSSGWARRVLWQMTRDGELVAHESRNPASNRRIRYYSLRPVPLKAAEFRLRYSVLHFCHMREPRHTLLPLDVFAALAQRMCTKAQLPLQPYQPCYLEASAGGGDKRLSLIRVAPARVTENLNHAMADLQTFAGGERFRLWIYFARLHLISITYLLPGEKDVEELTRWLTRHPLVSRIGRLQAAVPVIVERGVYV